MRTMTEEHAVRELASRQHGLVSRRQLRERGWPPPTISRRIDDGVFLVLSKRVLRIAGSPETDHSSAMAAVLDSAPGAAVSHRSAAAMWSLPGFRLHPVEVLGDRRRVNHGDHPLAVVHQPRRLLAHHVVELDRIPVTTPSRMLFDLAGSPEIHPLRLERLLDTCWSRHLVSHASLTSMLSDLARKGRSGITLMRVLLDARPPDHRPPDSSSEARFQELARSIGLTGFERQTDVGDEHCWIGRVDFFDQRRRLLVEVDSAMYHGSLTDQAADEIRHSRLRLAGLRVMSVSDFDLFHRSDDVLARLCALRRA